MKLIDFIVSIILSSIFGICLSYSLFQQNTSLIFIAFIQSMYVLAIALLIVSFVHENRIKKNSILLLDEVIKLEKKIKRYRTIYFVFSIVPFLLIGEYQFITYHIPIVFFIFFNIFILGVPILMINVARREISLAVAKGLATVWTIIIMGLMFLIIFICEKVKIPILNWTI